VGGHQSPDAFSVHEDQKVDGLRSDRPRWFTPFRPKRMSPTCSKPVAKFLSSFTCKTSLPAHIFVSDRAVLRKIVNRPPSTCLQHRLRLYVTCLFNTRIPADFKQVLNEMAVQY